MSPLAQSFRTAAGALREISERAPGERGRRASAGALVLRAVEGAMIPGASGANFLGRRAEAEVTALPRSPERASLRRLLALLGRDTGPRSERLANGLVGYACELERTRRLAEADAALTLALSLAPLDAEIALHAGRVARKLGERERALDLYRAARALDGAAGAVARLAAVGEAVISPQPAVALGRVIRAALSSGDGEAAAVGLEER
ncbi:MAG: hypothetical protein M3483_08590, partial [Gemmatimonadota bacterium]|nr:hypothetical protein [Gemmatimonadota bacterium]